MFIIFKNVSACVDTEERIMNFLWIGGTQRRSWMERGTGGNT